MNCKIIAELAQGYEGKLDLALLLAKGAIRADADAIKIQLVFADELCVPSYPYFDLFKSLEMPFESWLKFSETVKGENKELIFDIYGPKSLAWAKELKADGIKISTTDFYNQALIENAASEFSKIYLSIGGIPLEDIKSVVEPLLNTSVQLTLMHGFQAEPTPLADNHLLRISEIKRVFSKAKVGFMDHSDGQNDEAHFLPVLALGQNVDAIEKHLSLDHLLEVEDHISALTPTDFSKFVKNIRKYEAALGSETLELTDKEQTYRKKASKVVVASKPLKAGTVIGLDDILLKRFSTEPSDIHFRKSSDVIGNKLLADIQTDVPFTHRIF